MDRLYYTYYIIKNQKDPIPAKRIKELLETEYDIVIEIKTVYQMIKNLNTLFELFCGKTLIRTIRRTGYIIEDDFLEDGQIQYLLDSIVSSRGLSKDEAQKMIDSLMLLSSKNQIDRLNLSNISHNDNKNDMFISMTNVIKAIHNKKTIYFRYIDYNIQGDRLVEVPRMNGNKKDDKQYYIISPYKLVLKNSKYYVIGYCNKYRNQLTTFRLDRMRLVRIYKSIYQDISEQFDLEKAESNINMYNSGTENTLEIEFDSTVLREVVSQFGLDNHVEKVFNDKYKMIIEDVLISDGLIGWLMMLQDHIRVLSPMSLKDTMKEKIMNMMELYK